MEVTGDSFVAPHSRSWRRVCKEQANISTPHSDVTISTLRPFSPSSRPATGTPRPQLPRYLKAARDISLKHSSLSKNLMVTANCGSNSMAGILSASLTDGGKKSTRFPTLALASTPDGRSDGFSSSRRAVPATPHTSKSVGVFL